MLIETLSDSGLKAYTHQPMAPLSPARAVMPAQDTMQAPVLALNKKPDRLTHSS